MSIVDKLVKDLRKECTFLGSDAVADNLIDKMCQLCLENRITAEELVSSWIAFATTKGLPTNSKPTLQLLDHLNRDELSKEKGHKSKGKQHGLDLDEVAMDEDADDLLEAYGTPVTGRIKRQKTPETKTQKRRLGQIKSPLIFSPGSYSPESVNTPSSKYTSRTNSGDVLTSFGKSFLDLNWENNELLPVTLHAYDEASTLTKEYCYMYEKLPVKAKIQNQWLEDMGLQLHKVHGLIFASPSEIRMAMKQTILGRVWSDGLGKLNVNQLRIEGPLHEEKPIRIVLDVSNLSKFSFFPGQLIAIEGINSQEKFIVEKIYDGIPLPFSHCITNDKEKQGVLQIVVAAGPYTTSDDSTYNPLMDLLTYLEKHKPHACILIGPFVDSKSNVLSKHFEEQNSELCSYDDIFQSLIKTITGKIDSSKTQLIIIPSLRDLHHTHFVYPTAPFKHPKLDHVHFMPDPCVIEINGITVGITSVDILFHLGKEELPSNGSTDRLGRLASHILKQQNFYPLCPPHEDVNIDYQHFDLHAGLPVTPDILILPSDLKHFIKNLDGCCCINPERLVKGICGGTFARIQVDAHSRNPGSSIIESITAQIVKI